MQYPDVCIQVTHDIRHRSSDQDRVHTFASYQQTIFLNKIRVQSIDKEFSVCSWACGGVSGKEIKGVKLMLHAVNTYTQHTTYPAYGYHTVLEFRVLASNRCLGFTLLSPYQLLMWPMI